jgi:gentisate 1,2-dioxygenase
MFVIIRIMSCAQRNREIPKLLAASNEGTLEQVLELESPWICLLCHSYDSPNALSLLERVLERVKQLGGLKKLAALEESGRGRKLVEIATPQMKQAIQKRCPRAVTRTHTHSYSLVYLRLGFSSSGSTAFSQTKFTTVPHARSDLPSVPKATNVFRSLSNS